MMSKISKLTSTLLESMPDETLELTKKSALQQGDTLVKLVEIELAKRKALGEGRYNVRGKLSSVYGKASRYVGRTMYAADLQAEVLRELTMVNGYFMLAKAQYDAAMSFFASRVPGWSEGAAAAIEASPEFRTYLVPPPAAVVANSTELNRKVEESAPIVQEGVQEQADQDVEKANTAPQSGDVSPTQQPGAGGGATRRRRVVVGRRRQ